MSCESSRTPSANGHGHPASANPRLSFVKTPVHLVDGLLTQKEWRSVEDVYKILQDQCFLRKEHGADKQFQSILAIWISLMLFWWSWGMSYQHQPIWKSLVASMMHSQPTRLRRVQPVTPNPGSTKNWSSFHQHFPAQLPHNYPFSCTAPTPNRSSLWLILYRWTKHTILQAFECFRLWP